MNSPWLPVLVIVLMLACIPFIYLVHVLLNSMQKGSRDVAP